MILPKQSQCLKEFGNPFAKGWAAKNVVEIAPPFAMAMGKIHIPHIEFNKIAAASLSAALNTIAEMCDHDPVKIAAAHANKFSGSYNPRNMRGLNAISMHAYALAIDFDEPNNLLNAPDGKCFFHQNSIVVQAFLKNGAIWGGNWKGRRDAMHFQFAIVG